MVRMPLLSCYVASQVLVKVADEKEPDKKPPLVIDRAAAQGLIDYINASPSPYHVVAETARQLEERNFKRLEETKPWPKEPGRYYVIRRGSIAAWAVQGDFPQEPSFRIIAGHTDSPTLQIKPSPDMNKAGFCQLDVEVYGAPLLSSFFDRDLGLSGKVVVRKDNLEETKLFWDNRAILRIPNLAIHLNDRDAEIKLDKQKHLNPIWSLEDCKDGFFKDYLAKILEVSPSEVQSWHLLLTDTQPARFSGLDQERIEAPRLDNLGSCYAALQALLKRLDRENKPTAIPMIFLFQDEEIGSQTYSGAQGSFFDSLVDRIIKKQGGDDEAVYGAKARSLLVSSDATHAGHPNYLDRSEPEHAPFLNKGPVIKVNAVGRYATTAETQAIFQRACDKAGVPFQFFVNRNDLPCGSTIGPFITSRVGIPAVDVGMAQLSMHSIRETAGAGDVGLLIRAFIEIFE